MMGDQQVYAAWVSAGAAVVQAIAATVAIWYAGKLARDASEREKAADKAATRRINEANAAAAEQRQLDREAAEQERNRLEVRAFNEPLSLAIGIAEQALAEIVEARGYEERKAQRGELDQHGFQATPSQLMVLERFPALVGQAKDAESAAAIRATQLEFAPFNDIVFQTASKWLPMIDGRICKLRVTIESLREQIIHADY